MAEHDDSLEAPRPSSRSERASPARGGGELLAPRGPLLAAVSQAMVQLHSRYYGKGPTRAKSYLLDDMVVCVLQDIFTPVEKTLVEVGRSDQVRQTRHVFQQAMEVKFRHAIEEVTGRKVAAFLSMVHVGPDISVEMFLLEPEEERSSD